MEDARNNPIRLHRIETPAPAQASYITSPLPSTILPTTISTCVVRHLLSQHPSLPSVKGCVVGVPAYFNEVQKSETESCVKAAFSDSGVGDAVRVKVITEPEAASLAYSVASRGRKEEVGPSSSPTEENILVFDLGGGTFDVTVVNVGYKSSGVVAGVEILATGGDRYLGGDDFDKLLASYLWEKYGGDGWNEWENFAREAKIKLSSSNKVERMVGLPVAGRGLEDFGEGDGGEILPGSTRVSVTRSELNKCLEPLLPRLINPVREACILGDICLLGDASPFTKEKLFGGKEGGRKAARMRDTEIQSYKSAKQKVVDTTGIPLSSLKDAPGRRSLSRVILVGGSTRVPLISSLLTTLTGVTPTVLKEVPPVHAVAMGCAIQGGILDGVFEDEEDEEGGFGVMTNMQAALLRALVEKERVLKERRERGEDGVGGGS
ncbi:hypothetical protein TrCOL_g7304 [Triparma columacea]|uniref:Heat shock protein 70 n=1 Tax=Triparma columacea TaxID=722753 RepID=A0A9W7FXU2_9STRA|nr:hypothetical protein TrCOL_g7304 [Triparma columacea]